MSTKQFQAAAIFKDHMVLQRDKDICIWGTGQNGLAVCAELAENKGSTKIANGEWKLTLPPMPAGGPYKLILSAGSDVVVFEDILIGEVWLAGGQSNMDMPLMECEDSARIFKKEELGGIRYYNVPKIAFWDEMAESTEREGVWKCCIGSGFGDISGAAFFFAKQIYETLHVPVGIISCCWGGTSVSCWVDEQSLEATPDGRYYLCEYEQAVDGKTDTQYDEQMKAYHVLNNSWLERVEQVRRERPDASWSEISRLAGHGPWPQPMGRTSPYRPSGLFHTMLERIAGYTIHGFLYYQGEEDTRHASMYGALLESLILQWRKLWGDNTLPFLFVQLPMYIEWDAQDDRQWALLREQQFQVHRRVANTGLAVLADCGERDNIHPTDKKTVGNRLALQVLKRCYGFDVSADAPYYRSHEIVDNRVYVYFDNAEEGLTVRGETITGFQLAGQDEHFYDADAELFENNGVCLISENVPHPCYVRYAWSNYTKVSLFARSGLPVAPFRA